ncbi:MAG: InlB B-repeat-containing protein, partial [Oscillospiraceae bacterium]|nr:InlB B-repeat-containing protein [Oscillospiraceae bacterium]
PPPAVTHTISFDANGGNGNMAAASVADGESYSVPANTFNTFTRANHTFTGWNTAFDGSGTPYPVYAVFENVTDDITLYAQWLEVGANTAYLNFNANGGDGLMAPMVRSSLAKDSLPDSAFTRDGYTFTGWYQPAQQLGTGGYLFSPGHEFTFGGSPHMSNTLYAQWEPIPGDNERIIAYHSGIGNLAINASNSLFGMSYIVTAVKGEEHTLIANPFEARIFEFPYTYVMEFKGWHDTHNDIIYQPGEKFEVTSDSWPPSTNLDAIWERAGSGQSYTVSFNANGGGGTMEPVTVPSGLYTPVNTFTPPAGKIFLGWSSSSTGPVIGLPLNIGSNRTLWAIWGDAPDGPDPELSGIDYSGTDLTVPGSAGGFSINLTKELFVKPETYTIVAFSIDGGKKWKAAKADTFSDTKFNKLLNKDLELQLSDKAIEKTTKQPGEGATIITFPKINKRPKMDKLVVNYVIGADATGATTGEWVLTEKNGTTSLKADIEVGAANGKVVDANGYGKFFGSDGSTNGIGIIPLTGAKPAKTPYFIRSAPKPADDNGAFTAASKAKRINVLGEQKAPNYKVNKGVIKYKANTVIQQGGGAAAVQTAKGEWDTEGEVTLWMAATAKKPASAKQVLTVTVSP